MFLAASGNKEFVQYNKFAHLFSLYYFLENTLYLSRKKRVWRAHFNLKPCEFTRNSPRHGTHQTLQVEWQSFRWQSESLSYQNRWHCSNLAKENIRVYRKKQSLPPTLRLMTHPGWINMAPKHPFNSIYKNSTSWNPSPKVSTIGNFFTMTCFLAIRSTPRTSVTMTTMGRPSGMAATARLDQKAT